MKVTLNDLEQIMKEVRAGHGEEIPKDVKALVVNICEMLGQTPYTKELYDTVIRMGLKFAATENKGAEDTLMVVAALSGSACMTIGFRLGLREAGLSLGIGTPTSKEN